MFVRGTKDWFPPLVCLFELSFASVALVCLAS